MALTQAVYRFGSDTGTNETDHGWLAGQNTPIRVGATGDVGLDTVFLLRFGYQNNATAAANINFTVQYKINAGSWVTITTTSAGVKAVAAAVLTNNGNTTNRLTGLTGTFQGATGQAEDGDAGGNSMDIASNGCAEAIFSIQVNSAGVSLGDVITFQSLQEGSALAAYTVTPKILITTQEAPSVGGTTLSGVAPSRILNHIRAATLGAVALAGLAPTLQIVSQEPFTVSPPAGAMSVSASAPTVPRLRVVLKEGTTERASRYANITSSLTTHELALTTDERNAITNWSDLSLSLVAHGGQIEVSFAELEAPAQPALSEAPSAGSLALSGQTPVRRVDYYVAPGAGSVAIGGQTPAGNYQIAVASGAIETYGFTPIRTVWAPVEVTKTPAAASLSVSGGTPTVPSLTVELWSSSNGTDWTKNATQRIAPSGSLATYEYALTASEAASVEWANLRFTIIADYAQSEVTWLELETPSALAENTAAPASGGMVFSGLAPTVLSSATISPSTGALAISGQTPAIPAFVVTLKQGDQTIAAVPFVLSGSLATYEYELTEGQLYNITDWSDLNLSFSASGAQVEVTWAELQAPQLGSDHSASVPAGSLSLAGQTPTEQHPYFVYPDTGALVLSHIKRFSLELWESFDLRLTREVELLDSYATYEFELTAEEIASINDWEDLEIAIVADGGRARVAWVGMSAPDWGIAMTTGSLALSGVYPAAYAEGEREPATAAIVFSGTVPTTSRAFVATPPVGSIIASGLDVAPDLPPEQNIRRAGSGEMSVSGEIPAVLRDYLMEPGSGALVFSSFAPGHYPYGLLWMDAGVQPCGIQSERITVAGANPSSARMAGIAADHVEYEI